MPVGEELTTFVRAFFVFMLCCISGELQRFNEKNGHFRVPSANRRGTKHRRLNEEVEEETIKLGKWAKRQRHLSSKNELPPERSVALEQIGFDFKPAPATKEERLEVQLGLLDALRKQRELSNAQVEDLNFLFDEWKRRANEPKPKPAFAKESNNKFDVKWQQSFQLLKQFQVSSICVCSYIHSSPFTFHLW